VCMHCAGSKNRRGPKRDGRAQLQFDPGPAKVLELHGCQPKMDERGEMASAVKDWLTREAAAALANGDNTLSQSLTGISESVGQAFQIGTDDAP
jgi:hypothetical protein